MTTFTEIQFVQEKIKLITGNTENVSEMIEDLGMDSTLKILAHAYYTACIATNTPVEKINCIQDTLDMRAADDILAAKYDA